MKYDFITIGGVTRDISFFTDQGISVDNKNDILHQQLIGFEAGAKIKVDKFYYSYGGGAANAAACLANFDFKVACLTSIGNDTNGRLILKNLENHQIDTRLIKKVSKEESGSSFILITPDGERIIFAQRGANKDLVITKADVVKLKKTKNIYIASLAGNWLDNLKSIFSAVGDSGPNVFWNPGMTQLLDGAIHLKSFLEKTTVLACNKDEALTLVLNTDGYKDTNHEELNKPENLIKIVHSFGPKNVVITMGAEGAMVYNGQELKKYNIIKEVKRVDMTGIGDIFNSSFAAGWTLFDQDIDKAINLSLHNAAAKVSHIGAQSGLLTKDDITK